jgi:RNA-binding protein
MPNDHGLTGKQVRFLRARGHHLKPAVLAGKEGLTPQLINSAVENLAVHELIKIKLLDSCPIDRKTAAHRLREQTASHLVQILGRTILLYKAAEKPGIPLP